MCNLMKVAFRREFLYNDKATTNGIVYFLKGGATEGSTERFMPGIDRND